jgi:hypothetical protein
MNPWRGRERSRRQRLQFCTRPSRSTCPKRAVGAKPISPMAFEMCDTFAPRPFEVRPGDGSHVWVGWASACRGIEGLPPRRGRFPLVLCRILRRPARIGREWRLGSRLLMSEARPEADARSAGNLLCQPRFNAPAPVLASPPPRQPASGLEATTTPSWHAASTAARPTESPA